MGKTLQYVLYSTVCIVSLIIVFICFWWFTAKPYTKEDFIVAAPYVVMVGLTSTGAVYYADIDVPMSPKWINTGITGVGDIAGSYGQLFTIGTGGGVQYGPYDSTGQNMSGSNIRTMSIDDNGSILMTNSTGVLTYVASATANTPQTIPNLNASKVSANGGAMFVIDSTAKLWYYPFSSTTSGGVLVNVPGVTQWLQVSYDGAVCALQTDGTLWCADTNIGSATANWKQQGTKKFSQISLKGGRLVGVGFGADTATYYSNTYLNPSWTTVTIKQYNGATGATVSGAVTFTKVIMIYPALDARRKRFVVSGTPCGEDEQQIGNFCYAACASGRAAVGTKCPYRRKQSPPMPSCTSGEYINGSCYQPCPDNSTTPQGDLCVGNIAVKNVTSKLPSTAPNYSCGDGTIGARYVRIRPTTIPSVQNNKVCISKLVVKDKEGNVLSLPSATPGITSTIGTITGSWIYSGAGSIPITAVKTMNVPGAGSSTTPLKIYLAQYGSSVAMIANDAVGTAKYYSGTVSAWTDTYWNSGASAGTRASQQYVLNLNTKPVTTYATDGTCVDTPIGGKSCPGTWSTYVSGAKYDTEADGGRLSRQSKTYWEIDLGAVQQIRTIEFTGCNYVPATGATQTAIDPNGLSQPNADQITGMRIELLQSANQPTTEAIADRTLGPQIRQILTFNYLSKEPGIDDTCYDACPNINGVQSIDGGQQTCIAASGGVTSRSITTPLRLPPPVCGLPKNADGTPYTMPAEKLDQSKWTIGNWVINPKTPTQVLSCDVLPGSTLVPLQNTFNIPVTSNSSPATISYTLQDPTNTNYTAADPAAPYKCAIIDDSACTPYNVNGAVYKYRGGMCVRMDVSPDFQMNDEWHDSGTGNADYRFSGCGPGLRNDGTACWSYIQCGGDPAKPIWDSGHWRCWGGDLQYYQYQVCNDSNRDYYGGFCFNKCPSGYSRYTDGGVATYQWCRNNNRDPTWGRKWTGNDPAGIGLGGFIYRYGLRGAKTLYDLMNGKAVVSNPPSSAISSPDDFKIPLVPNNKSVIVDPQVFPAQCKCLNADGTVNTQAYIYNNTCVKCADPNQLFYAKGTISSDFAWGEEQKNKFLSIYDDAITRPIDQKPFTTLNDAKTMCNTDPFCKGVTRSYDAAGKAYYYQRAGTLLKGTPPSSADSGSSSAVAGSSAGAATQTWDSSWVKGAKGSDKVVTGLRKGTTYSTADIPTAFADDFISPTSKGSSTFSIIPAAVTNLVNSMTNEVLQAASAWASFQNSVQNPNTYYNLVGVERQLRAAGKPSDNGICVAPCDPTHTLHDPIQMIYDPTASMYVLYGTTCHDATQTVISRPSIPATYTPQVGADCAPGYNLNSSGSCVQECNSSSIDKGSSCAGNSVRRPSIAPVLSCPTGLTLVGGTCVHPCGDGYTQDGDFCQPIVSTFDVPSSINCVKTPYTYSNKYQGSATTSVNKWLCDSEYDQYMLLEGPTGSSITAGTASYVNPNDIICYADDSSTGMYYCQTYTDAMNQAADTQRTDFSTSCDSMTKAYIDLSNNLTTLMSAKMTAQNASLQVAAMVTTLQSVIQQMCGTGSGSSSGSSSATCNALRTQLAALNSNINSGSGTLSGVLTPIGVATSSRDKLITLLRDMKCCPVGETSYPWC